MTSLTAVVFASHGTFGLNLDPFQTNIINLAIVIAILLKFLPGFLGGILQKRREVILADGHRRTVPYMGPIEVRFANRRCFTGAMVLGNEVLLGAIPMEDMDLVLRPQLQSITVNPESPNIPLRLAK